MNTYLFSFVDFRNPQKITVEDKERYYLSLPSELISQTHFYSNLETQTFAQHKVEFERRSKSFAALLRMHDLSRSYGVYLSVFQEMRSEKYRASWIGIGQFIKGLKKRLSKKEIINLWDNLAVYLLVNPSEQLVQHIVSVLIADTFLAKVREFVRANDTDDEASFFTKEQQAQLWRLARHAKVVLGIPVASGTTDQNASSLSMLQKQLMISNHDHLVSQFRRQQFERLSRALVQSQATRGSANPTSSASPSGNELEEIKKRLSDKERKSLVEMEAENDTLATVQAKLTDVLSTDSVEAVSTSTQTAVYIHGNLLTREDQLPPTIYSVKRFALGENKYNYYLTYFTGNAVENVMQRVEGRFIVDDQTFSLSDRPPEYEREGFQLFKLNENPIVIEDSPAVASFSLQLVPALQPTEPVVLPQSNTVGAHPVVEMRNLGLDSDIAAETKASGTNRLQIADFRRVEQELACYVPGEVSHIENILASEYKEKVTRNTIISETEIEETEESENEAHSDTVTADKLEMQSEANEVLKEARELGIDVGTSVGGQIGPVTFSAEAGVDYNTSSSKEQSNSAALNFAREVTEKITRKIVEKRSSRRKSLSRREFEDVNKHGFDNREGTDHVVGIYRWVDKIYNNYLVNYGKRLTYEFMVPEPAMNFIGAQIAKRLLEQQANPLPKRPISPQAAGLERILDITPNGFYTFAQLYNADVEQPPRPRLTVSRSFSFEVQQKEGKHAFTFNELEIPEGYTAERILTVSGSFVVHGENTADDENDPGDTTLTVSITGYSETFFAIEDHLHRVFRGGESVNEEDFLLDSIEGILPVSVSVFDIASYAFSVTVDCKRTDQLLEEWRLRTFNLIMLAYQDRLAEYESAMSALKAREGEGELNFNSGTNRQIERTELKLSCINMLTKPFDLNYSGLHYVPGLFPPEVLQSKNLEQQSKMAKFLESAVEWTLMAYTFYPYYYAHRASWYLKMNIEGGSDPIFKSFLSAGFARVKVPVRKGYEKAFIYFLETGDIWTAPEFVLDTENDIYTSIDDELATADDEIRIEQSWASKIPTNLTILQKNAWRTGCVWPSLCR